MSTWAPLAVSVLALVIAVGASAFHILTLRRLQSQLASLAVFVGQLEALPERVADVERRVDDVRVTAFAADGRITDTNRIAHAASDAAMQAEAGLVVLRRALGACAATGPLEP